MKHESLIGLGRKQIIDENDLKYKLKAVPPKRGISAKTWYVRGVLDQGATSQCVAYSGAKYLETHPVQNKLHIPIPQLYKEVQRIDEWPGEDYDGTSVRALFKWLKANGYVSEYRWAWDVDTMVAHLLSTGPMVVGTDWYMEMFMPDRHDFITPAGAPAGGHAYLIIGIDTRKRCPDGSMGAFRILNSWGFGWSENGRAWISFKDMQRLLDLQGEACVATEIPRVGERLIKQAQIARKKLVEA